MIKVNAQINWDQAKVLDTWRPVLEKAGIPDRIMQAAADYAHCHAIMESANTGISFSFANPPAPSEHKPSMLPVAIKILSLLDLDGKNVQITPGPNYEYIDDVTEKTGFGETHLFQVSVNMPRTEPLSPQLAEELLIKKITDMINFNLRRFDTIVIYSLAESISIISEATLAPKLYLKCRIKFWDRNGVPENLYQVSNTNEQYHINRVDVAKDSYINTKDENGNSYILDPEDGSYIMAISESDVLRLAEEIESRAETLKNSASILRRAIFEK